MSMIDSHLAWFAIGATFGSVLCGWPWHPRFSRYKSTQRDNGGPTTPKQPLAADLIRYSRWKREQIELALRDEPPTKPELALRDEPPTKPEFPSPRKIREDFLP